MVLPERVAIVTGGGRGIGQATAVALASEGIAVAVLARTQSEVERTAARIRADGGSSVALTGDVSDHGSATQIVAAAEQDLQAALLHLSRVMHAENRDRGIRVFAIEPGVVQTEMNRSLAAVDETGVRASVVQMLRGLAADPGFVEAGESAQLIRMTATGEADDLAGEAHSIYDPAVRARIPAAT